LSRPSGEPLADLTGPENCTLLSNPFGPDQLIAALGTVLKE